MTSADPSIASILFPAVAVALLAVLWLLDILRPGWTEPAGAALRPVWRAGGRTLVVLGAIAVGLAADPLARRGLAFGVGLHLPPVVAPLGTWFSGPDLPRDLTLVVAVVLTVLADRRRLLAWRPTSGERWRGAASRAGWTLLTVALPVGLLLLGWVDVLASTLGQHVAGAYRGLEMGGWLAWHPWAQLVAPPDPRLISLYWWLAASLLAARLRDRLPRYGRAWAAVPVGGALLALVGRPLALTLALPAFALVAVAAVVLAPQRRAAAAVAERAMLIGLLGLAFALRWAPGMLRLPASDAEGYFNVGRIFWERVAEAGTNPIALAYLNMHPASREPLFPLLLQIMFGLFGADLVYQRYLTVGLAVVGVYLTYRFGRCCFGPAVGLLSALVVAVLPWQVVVSQEGLREELGLACVYGLAVLVVSHPWPLSVREGRQGDLPRHLRWPVAAAGGALAAGAVLTRLDAGAVVGVLLLAWAFRLRGAWRDTLPAWIVSGALVAPMLFGYVLRAGDPLTPLRGSMGGDIQAAMTPLTRGELPASYVLWAMAVGMREVYAGTIFGSPATLLPGALQALAVGVALASLAAGSVASLWRGPRLPVLLAYLGVFLPPFTYLAGTSVLHGPGGGYTDRYTYLILPAVLAVSTWALLSAGRRLSAARWARLRSPSPLPAGAIALQGPPKARAKS